MNLTITITAQQGRALAQLIEREARAGGWDIISALGPVAAEIDRAANEAAQQMQQQKEEEEADG